MASIATASLRLSWKDAKYHCPGYKGLIGGMETANYSPHQGPPFGSYAYNANGVSMPGAGKPYDPDLGLGFLPSGANLNNSLEWGRPPVPDHRVMAPSEMFSIGESRFLNPTANGMPGGSDLLRCGLLYWVNTNTSFNFSFDPARHGKNYNQLLCDGHVVAMSPWVLFNPTNTATSWNIDHQAHPELWVPDQSAFRFIDFHLARRWRSLEDDKSGRFDLVLHSVTFPLDNHGFSMVRVIGISPSETSILLFRHRLGI